MRTIMGTPGGLGNEVTTNGGCTASANLERRNCSIVATSRDHKVISIEVHAAMPSAKSVSLQFRIIDFTLLLNYYS